MRFVHKNNNSKLAKHWKTMENGGAALLKSAQSPTMCKIGFAHAVACSCLSVVVCSY